MPACDALTGGCILTKTKTGFTIQRAKKAPSLRRGVGRIRGASSPNTIFSGYQLASRNRSAACKSTDTSWLMPFSCMVTPNSRFMRLMVIG